MTMEKRADQLNNLLERNGENFRLIYENVAKDNAFRECYVIVSEKSNVNPVLYKDRWFDMPDAEVISFLKDFAEKHLIQIDDPCKLASKDYILENIYPRLISQMDPDYAKNSDIAHVQYLDMDIIMDVHVTENASDISSYRVTNRTLQDIGMDKESLLTYAINNLSKRLKVMDMEEVLSGYGCTPNLIEGDSARMYILTSTTMINGAAGILCTSGLSQLAQYLGNEFYILPSSRHEVIAVSVDHDVVDLKEIVEHANVTVVNDTDRLTDSVYWCKDGKITIAG